MREKGQLVAKHMARSCLRGQEGFSRSLRISPRILCLGSSSFDVELGRNTHELGYVYVVRGGISRPSWVPLWAPSFSDKHCKNIFSNTEFDLAVSS